MTIILTFVVKVAYFIAINIVTLFNVHIIGHYVSDGYSTFAPVQTHPGGPTASYTVRRGSFPGIKRTGCRVNHTPPSGVEVTENVDLYPYTPSVPSWQVIR
jgi:hypothetical protein